MKNFAFIATFAVITINSGYSSEEKVREIYRDKLTGNHMYICSEDKDTLHVAESCGKYWDKYPRKRDQLAKLVTEYKDIKKGDEVMIPIKKEGVMTWAIGTVSWIYEDGQISVMEYYTNPGPTGGTYTFTMDYKYIARKNLADLSKEKEVCAKDAFEIHYGPSNKKKYEFEKGEKLTVRETFNNGLMTVSYQGFMKNFFSYGKDSKLPIEQNKVEACKTETEVEVDDGKREQKPVTENETRSKEYLLKNIAK